MNCLNRNEHNKDNALICNKCIVYWPEFGKPNTEKCREDHDPICEYCMHSTYGIKNSYCIQCLGPKYYERIMYYEYQKKLLDGNYKENIIPEYCESDEELISLYNMYNKRRLELYNNYCKSIIIPEYVELDKINQYSKLEEDFISLYKIFIRRRRNIIVSIKNNRDTYIKDIKELIEQFIIDKEKITESMDSINQTINFNILQESKLHLVWTRDYMNMINNNINLIKKLNRDIILLQYYNINHTYDKWIDIYQKISA